MKKRAWNVALLILLACASTPGNLKRATANAVGGISASEVVVSNVHRGVRQVSWQADTPKGQYDCSADDTIRNVNCAKR